MESKRYKLKGNEEKVCSLYKEGKPSTEIAAQFSVSPASVLQCLNKMGVARRTYSDSHPLKSHCKRGHELSGNNVRVKGKVRYCKKCCALHSKNRWKENPEKNQKY